MRVKVFNDANKINVVIEDVVNVIAMNGWFTIYTKDGKKIRHHFIDLADKTEWGFMII